MPAWLLPALLGGAGGYGLSTLLGNEDDEGGIKKTSTLSPEQQQIMSALGLYLQGQLDKGGTAYTGNYTAPLSSYEQTGLQGLGSYLNAGVTPFTQQGLDTYSSLMNVDPNAIAADYMKYTAPAEQRYLKDVLIPTTKESQVAGGTVRSTGTARAIGDVVSKFGEGQLGRIGETIEGAKTRAAGLTSQLGTMAGIEGGVPQMEAAFQYGQLPRMIEQAELTGQIEEFKRQNPDMTTLLDKMLSFLGVTTTAAFNQPYTPSPFMQFVGAMAPGVGQGIGSYLAAA